nr:reverse transcriptase [Tanacetum cinerariifolium]
VKVNYDASWIKESEKVGLGFVARNHNGEVLLSGALGECFAKSPLESEAKGTLTVKTLFEHKSDYSAKDDVISCIFMMHKSLEKSAVTKADPLDMSKEVKAESWFKRVAQIKGIWS